jgi:calcineurin-like phosphoesterase
VLPRFINALPTRFEVGDGPVIFNGTQIDIDPASGRALAIERIQRLIEV